MNKQQKKSQFKNQNKIKNKSKNKNKIKTALRAEGGGREWEASRSAEKPGLPAGLAPAL